MHRDTQGAHSFIHNVWLNLKRQKKGMKRTLAFRLKSACLCYVKPDGTVNVTSLPLLKIIKSCLLQKAFGRTSNQPKQMHECGENTDWKSS